LWGTENPPKESEGRDLHTLGVVGIEGGPHCGKGAKNLPRGSNIQSRVVQRDRQRRETQVEQKKSKKRKNPKWTFEGRFFGQGICSEEMRFKKAGFLLEHPKLIPALKKPKSKRFNNKHGHRTLPSRRKMNFASPHG